ncbi:MAG: hydrogenase expression/formation protein HypE [Tepidisphaeraceae bacterium]
MTTDTPHLRPAVADNQWKQILRAHGGGGLMTDALLRSVVFPRLANATLDDLLDSALLDVDRSRLAFTIDSYVVQPIEFPGGDIGRLCISGTVNDLSVCGATPIAIALGLILPEGLPRTKLERVMDSIAATAREANVRVVTGDTKVIGRTDGESIFISTAGVGAVRADARPHPKRVQPGDVVLLSGSIADHGVAVMLARELPQVKSVVRSDVAPLNALVNGLFDRLGEDVVFLRDPTRGGMSGLAADLAERTGLHIELDEAAIPVHPSTLHAAEMLGLDPLDVANEGKIVAVVRKGRAEDALAALRSHPLGAGAAIVGRVTDERDGVCELLTTIGGRRVLQKPYGEQLPRIC